MSNMKLHGLWEIQHIRDGKVLHKECGENIVPYEGMNRILDALRGGVTLSTTWYVSLFKGNVTPALTDTAAAALGATGSYGECQDTDFSPATNRTQITFGSSANGSMTSTNTMQFTAIQNLTVYGGFVTDTQPKNDKTGVLLSAKRFASARAVLANDIIQVTVTYTMTSS
jgi:hypothetical protein